MLELFFFFFINFTAATAAAAQQGCGLPDSFLGNAKQRSFILFSPLQVSLRSLFYSRTSAPVIIYIQGWGEGEWEEEEGGGEKKEANGQVESRQSGVSH